MRTWFDAPGFGQAKRARRSSVEPKNQIGQAWHIVIMPTRPYCMMLNVSCLDRSSPAIPPHLTHVHPAPRCSLSQGESLARAKCYTVMSPDSHDLCLGACRVREDSQEDRRLRGGASLPGASRGSILFCLNPSHSHPAKGSSSFLPASARMSTQQHVPCPVRRF